MHFLTADIVEDTDNIRQILSSAGIVARTIERLPGGSRSYAFAADNLLVRFPKAEIIWKVMRREKLIIDVIYPFLEEKIPHKIHKTELVEEDNPFTISLRFNGKICDNRGEGKYTTGYCALSPSQQENMARQVAQFFAALHSFDYENPELPSEDASLVAAMESWDVTSRPDFDYEKAKTALLRQSANKINLDDYITDASTTPPALCHNDLSGSNLLINPEEYAIVAGIIDFGNARVVPVEQEFFPLYKINRKLALDTLKIYNKITGKNIDSRQIDALALKYIGHGLVKTEDNPSPYLLNLLRPFYD